MPRSRDNLKKDMLKTGMDVTKTSPNAHRFTHENRVVILMAKERGLADRDCAAAAGISADTLKFWLARGELQLDENNRPLTDECQYAQFWLDFQKAAARGILARHKKIEEYAAGGQLVEEESFTDSKGNMKTRRRYAPPQWQGLAWITERGFQHYSNRQILQHEGQVKQEITFVIPDNWRGNPSSHALPSAESEPIRAIESADRGDVIESSLVEQGVFE